jgi:hypothetical protein
MLAPSLLPKRFAIRGAVRQCSMPFGLHLVPRIGVAMLLLFATLGCPAASPLRAQVTTPLTVPVNLARMVDESENVVLARVTALRAEPHPQFQNLNTVVVTLEIIEPLKGSPGNQLVFRQYAPGFGAIGGKSMLGYAVGQEIVLLLRKPSAEGMTSPVGFEQGRFLVARDAAGNRSVRNGMDNAALFDGIDAASPGLKARLSPALQTVVAEHRNGPLPYDQFKSIVAGLIAASPPAR